MTESSQSPIKSTIYYLDANTQYQQNGQDILLQNVDAINNQIFNILTTIPGERPFEPEYGSKIPFMMFEPMDDITAWSMETEIFRALERWQPRIQLIYNLTSVVPLTTQPAYEVTIPYYVKLQNSVAVYRVKLSP